MTDIQQLSPADIVKWFRAQARKFNGIADTVEATFKGVPAAVNGHLPAPATEDVTVATIRRFLEGKAARIGEIADTFGVGKDRIKEIISDPNSRILEGDKGWLKLKE